MVLMCVEDDVLVTGSGIELAVPVCLKVLEGVVDGDCIVGASGRHGLVAGLVEVLDTVEVERAAEGFVEKLDGGYDVSVTGIALGEVLESSDGLGYCVTLLPLDGPVATRIVKAILTPRCW